MTTYNQLKYPASSIGNSSIATGAVSPDKLDSASISLINTAYSGQFWKANPNAVSFTATGAGTATTAFAIKVEINFVGYAYASSTTIVMPTLTTGTDYAIYACTDGTLRADSSFSAPVGYTVLTSRQIGGFHYAPGGNATAQSGGNTTPSINPYSFWDLKWRCRSGDNRGMTLCSNNLWVDIYLTNTNYITNGTSKYNVAYARGTTPAKKSPSFGGTGSDSYSSHTWYEANEIAKYAGKRLPSLDEMFMAAYGTTENSSIGTDQNNTILNAAYTSKWGVIQSTGVLWVWATDTVMRSDVAGGWNWYNTNGGRGQTYEYGSSSTTRAFFGGRWAGASFSGSRASSWDNAPSYSAINIGSRCVGDHLILV